jgi:Na+/proline symporter
MFVIVFPQLTLVLYWELANTYGSVVSFFIGILLRLLCGDSLMGIPATISFGTIYGDEASCPTDEDPLAACTGPVPFRLIVTIIGTVRQTCACSPY